MGTPTSKSCKPLNAEDNCSSTADYYLQVPYMSYHWNQIGLTIKYTRKQIIGTPTSNSGKPLIAEDDNELTAVSRQKWTDSYL